MAFTFISRQAGHHLIIPAHLSKHRKHRTTIFNLHPRTSQLDATSKSGQMRLPQPARIWRTWSAQVFLPAGSELPTILPAILQTLQTSWTYIINWSSTAPRNWSSYSLTTGFKTIRSSKPSSRLKKRVSVHEVSCESAAAAASRSKLKLGDPSEGSQQRASSVREECCWLRLWQ